MAYSASWLLMCYISSAWQYDTIYLGLELLHNSVYYGWQLGKVLTEIATCMQPALYTSAIDCVRHELCIAACMHA